MLKRFFSTPPRIYSKFPARKANFDRKGLMERLEKDGGPKIISYFQDFWHTEYTRFVPYCGQIKGLSLDAANKQIRGSDTRMAKKMATALQEVIVYAKEQGFDLNSTYIADAYVEDGFPTSTGMKKYLFGRGRYGSTPHPKTARIKFILQQRTKPFDLIQNDPLEPVRQEFRDSVKTKSLDEIYEMARNARPIKQQFDWSIHVADSQPKPLRLCFMMLHEDSNKKRKIMSSLSRSFNNSLGKSLGASLNKSYREGFLEAYYNFQFGSKSPNMIASPGRDLAHFAGLEDKFCKDFLCCGKKLVDLHDLLQHFEENHVCLESDMDDDDLPFEFESMDEMDMDTVDGKHYDIYLKQQNPPSIALSDISSQGYGLPAFDTNIIRKRLTPKSLKRTKEEVPLTVPLNMEGPTHIIDEDCMEVDEKKEMTEDESVGKEGRPYKCKIQGCHKSYKNPGGLKYHMQHGHCEDTGDPEMNNIIHKPYQCTVPECGKRYKNLNGLKYHIEHAHSSLLGPK